MASEGKVIVITSSAHFKQECDQSKADNKIVVIDFTATWCGPCRMIAPFFAMLAEKYPQVVFLKVDVDEQSDVAQQYEVRAMPTFAFLKEGVEVRRVVGANKTELEGSLRHLIDSTASA